uniref:Potassium channel tetramerisation-type BTB domain-containing protein n=1 Tax=Bos mutus grunniens TaxID=30521 RepID=A0A8C0AAC9_BOSMU
MECCMSGDTCLCPASGAKPKLGGFKGGGLGNKYVQLNVGGSLYYTTVRALTRHDTMLKAMFSGRMEVLTDKEGEVGVGSLLQGRRVQFLEGHMAHMK